MTLKLEPASNVVTAQGALLDFWAHTDVYKIHSCFEVGNVVVPKEEWLEEQRKISNEVRVTFLKQQKLGHEYTRFQLSEDGHMYHPGMLSLSPTSYGIDPNDQDKTYEVVCKVLADFGIDGKTYFKNLYRRTLDNDSEKQPRDWYRKLPCVVRFSLPTQYIFIDQIPALEIGYCAPCGAAYMKQQGTLVGSGGMSCPVCRRVIYFIAMDWLFGGDNGGREDARKAGKLRKNIRRRERKAAEKAQQIQSA
ncbi:hypothetical protein BT96DRAFT_1000933 [Gymnopus androsaceus JB14]|uniref:Uncharacterized protein n=1 Tax=Gymnopus androsaceus JB14 TaxID=1447944 RepID=A0A6A4H3B9_9AGAR|nr:hypothetical protein BT96DRAFT_1000933 [Gymnopus androsaceus JB14]